MLQLPPMYNTSTSDTAKLFASVNSKPASALESKEFPSEQKPVDIESKTRSSSPKVGPWF